MGLTLADPEHLRRLAKAMDDAAGTLPFLRIRASNLSVGGTLTRTHQLSAWLAEAAPDLRRRAGLLEEPSESPFLSLSAFDLPTRLAEDHSERERILAEFDVFYDENGIEEAGTHVSPEQAHAIKEYFRGLTPAEQAALAFADPETIGDLDGVPVNVRYAANRVTIQAAFHKESSYLESLPTTHPHYERVEDRVAELRGFLQPRVARVFDPDTGRPVHVQIPRQFLIFDPDFGSVADERSAPYKDGRVAEVVGDLESAGNVAFRIPGITNRLDNFTAFSRGGYNIVDRDGVEDPQTAVVNWLGYDTPEIGDSVDEEKANVGGRHLARFRNAIGVNLRPDAELSVLAHSYGTLATSKALQDGLFDVDHVVFMGSPGLGGNIGSAADFELPDTAFYAMRAPEDLVSYTQGHGGDPADFADITRLGTEGATGHSEYYWAGNESLRNLQRIVFREPDASLTTTDTALNAEMPGAQEIRDFVGFLHAKVPDELVEGIGQRLDPLYQDLQHGRIGLGEFSWKTTRLLSGNGFWDEVTPHEFFQALEPVVYAQADQRVYASLRDKGAPEWLARRLGRLAGRGASALFHAVQQPIVRILEYDRLQNSARRFGSSAWEGARSLGEDALEMRGLVLDARSETWKAGKDTLRNPSHAWSNAGRVANTWVETGGGLWNRGGEMWDSAWETGGDLWDKGGDVVHATADLLNPFG